MSLVQFLIIKFPPPRVFGSPDRFQGQAEFVEQFGEKEGEEGLTVSIPGEWFTEPGTNPFSGFPTTTIEIDPKKVIYGPLNSPADDWSSLGPIKQLDLIYLSEKIMISRVKVNPDYLFIWQRIQ